MAQAQAEAEVEEHDIDDMLAAISVYRRRAGRRDVGEELADEFMRGTPGRLGGVAVSGGRPPRQPAPPGVCRAGVASRPAAIEPRRGAVGEGGSGQAAGRAHLLRSWWPCSRSPSRPSSERDWSTA
jgi:hypothetical protein